MRSFFKSFMAALLALVVVAVVVAVIVAGIISGLLSTKRVELGSKAVIVLDLGQSFREQYQENPLADIGSENQNDIPGVYDIVRMIRFAKKDSAVSGIFIKCNSNDNGFATSEEIRNVLLDFKKSGKFIYASGDVISQKAYYVANVADKIYCNPMGGVEWKGFATELTFIKGALDKLEIEPQIFYAGKFKSATEPLREEKMSDANRLQTSVLLGGLYNRLLYTTAATRQLDTVLLRKAVNEHLIRYASDAMKYGLVDGLKYDDEIKAEIKSRLKVEKFDRINFLPIASYAQAVNYKEHGKEKITLIYAEGDIVDGKGGPDQIGADTYRSLIRMARLDKETKAIVIRVNSGGGSSMASENIWREITMARKEKPVVISFGDVAASGGYYLSCNADSIFAEPGSITGSIGVFSILPNMQKFFKSKLGITFDVAKTAPDADELSISKPLTPPQRKYFQNEVDSIYRNFKQRVSDGRKLKMEFVDSIAQGRVWSGEIAVQLGLVDKLGGLQDAVDCAVRMSKSSGYYLKEYPESKNFIDRLVGNYTRSVHVKTMKQELGEEGFKTYSTLKRVKALFGTPQSRLPFDLDIE